MQRKAVHGDGVADEVEGLAGAADGVGSSEPLAVVELPVNGFCVGASCVEAPVLGVGRRDGAEVLGSVELPAAVLVGGVEPDAKRAATGVVGDRVEAVPAPGAIGVAAGLDLGAVEGDEGDAPVAVGSPRQRAPASA